MHKNMAFNENQPCRNKKFKNRIYQTPVHERTKNFIWIILQRYNPIDWFLKHKWRSYKNDNEEIKELLRWQNIRYNSFTYNKHQTLNKILICQKQY